MQGTRLKHTVQGLNSYEAIDTQIVELKLTPVHSGGSCLIFVVKLLLRKKLNVRTDVIDDTFFNVQYLHLEPFLLKFVKYGAVRVIHGQHIQFLTLCKNFAGNALGP